MTEEPDDGFCNSRLFFIRFLRQIIFLIFFGLFSDVLIGCCVSILSSLLTFPSDLLNTLCGIEM